MRYRRELLSVLGTAAVAGCLESVPRSADRVTEVRLGSLFIEDYSRTETHYRVQLERNGEIVYQGERTVGSEYEIIHPSWSTEPAAYTLLWATDEMMGSASIPDTVDVWVPGSEEESLNGEDCYYPVIRRTVRPPTVYLLPHDETDEGEC